MRWHELKEFQTNDGREISIKRVPDSEGDRNRGFQIDTLEAHLDGRKVGYLNLAYIPKERFRAHYPSIIYYAQKMAGHIFFPYREDGVSRIDDMSEDELRTTIKRGFWIFANIDYSRTDLQDELASWDHNTLLEKLRELEAIIKKKLGQKFKEFKDYYVDKPVIDYIRVDENQKRQGIAFAMYREAALWMAEKGLKVYASGLQQPEAALAWAKMEQMGMIEYDGKRKFINPSKVK